MEKMPELKSEDPSFGVESARRCRPLLYLMVFLNEFDDIEIFPLKLGGLEEIPKHGGNLRMALLLVPNFLEGVRAPMKKNVIGINYVVIGNSRRRYLGDVVALRGQFLVSGTMQGVNLPE
jgi:hypothetical protein